MSGVGCNQLSPITPNPSPSPSPLAGGCVSMPNCKVPVSHFPKIFTPIFVNLRPFEIPLSIYFYAQPHGGSAFSLSIYAWNLSLWEYIPTRGLIYACISRIYMHVYERNWRVSIAHEPHTIATLHFSPRSVRRDCQRVIQGLSVMCSKDLNNDKEVSLCLNRRESSLSTYR